MGKDKRPEERPGTAPEQGGNYAGSHGPSGWPDMQGEGNKDAAREYNESQHEFVESGAVERAAHEAEPRSEEERAALERAEREGRSHARK